MPGFKRFETAAVTIRGIELAERIKKGQFKTDRLAGRPKRLRRFGLSSLLPNKLSRPAEAHNHVHQKLCTGADRLWDGMMRYQALIREAYPKMGTAPARADRSKKRIRQPM